MQNKISAYAVSLLTVLSDWIDINNTEIYINKEHKLLVEISDLLYHLDLSLDWLSREQQEIYSKYGENYFNAVLELTTYIDNVFNGKNIDRLILHYFNLTNLDCTILFEINTWH